MNHHLTAIIHREGEGYVALCPELDIASQGDSIEEARDNLKEALSSSSNAHRPRKSSDNLPGNIHDAARGVDWVRFPPSSAAGLECSSAAIVMQAQEESGSTTVPVPDHKELRIGTLRSIIRKLGSSTRVRGPAGALCHPAHSKLLRRSACSWCRGTPSMPSTSSLGRARDRRGLVGAAPANRRGDQAAHRRAPYLRSGDARGPKGFVVHYEAHGLKDIDVEDADDPGDASSRWPRRPSR